MLCVLVATVVLEIDRCSSVNDGLKFKIEDFESKSNIQVERIQQMLDSNYKLVNFDVNIDGEYIIFKNIKNTKKTRFVWGESANELG